MKLTKKHQPVCLQLSDSVRAIVLSESDYNSMIETLYLLSNPVNAEKLLQAVDRTDAQPTFFYAKIQGNIIARLILMRSKKLVQRINKHKLV